MKSLSEFVCCFLSVTEVFTTLTNSEEEEDDDPEVDSAIVPEISVKKNQPGCSNKAFCSFKETVCLCLRSLSILHLCWNSLLKSIFIN